MVVMNSSRQSWQTLRDHGKESFNGGNYEEALSKFRAALSTTDNNSSGGYYMSTLDRQILLSNVVACRLKLGGAAHARAAINDAKACIELNPSWSKAHVRLASAYIALGNHSNDACNALQTALRHDPNNRVARQMLIQELRRDHRQAAAASRSSSSSSVDDNNNLHTDNGETTSANTNSNPPPENPNYIPTDQPTGNNRDHYYENSIDFDDSATITDQMKFYIQRIHNWYYNLNDDMRTAIHIIIGLLVLYVAFGGRFGLSSSSNNQMKGHYGTGNIYDEYRKPHRTSSSKYSRSSDSSSRRTNEYDNYGYGNDYGSYGTGSYGSGGGYSSYNSSSSGWDSDGMIYILMTGAAFYVAHLLGISPWQMLFFMRVFGGRRGVGGGYMYGGGGFGPGRRGGGGMRFGRRRW